MGGRDVTINRGGAWTAPEYERPLLGETSREARERRDRNQRTRHWWDEIRDARCAECGMVRFHVSHEMDPETSPEGPAYHADFAHHAFVEAET